MGASPRNASAIVSGSATGIGAASAEMLARHDLDVVVNYNRSEFALGGRSITGQRLVIDGGTHLTVGNPL